MFGSVFNCIARLLLIVALSSACARAPLQNRQEALRRVAPPELSDDLPLEPLLKSVDAQIQYIQKLPPTQFGKFEFGSQLYTRDEYLQGLQRFAQLGQSAKSSQEFFAQIRNEFDFYEVYGREHWGEVLLTSYYEPLIEGSLKPTAKHSQPIYRLPDDLISIDLALFDHKFEGERRLRGRLHEKKLHPYFSREEIDTRGALKGRRLELCYVDPLDSFFLQIQGSATIILPDKKTLHVNYAEANGHKYEAVGQFLRDHIPQEQINMHTIEAFLRTLTREEMQNFLNKNPSYVFFRTTDQTAITYLGLPATDGRTIATDKNFFPKGALGFLSFEKPVFGSDTELLPASTTITSRFVLDQDIGGAINGGGRVDLFWGRGKEAARFAGAMKFPGRLFYLAPKRP